MQVIEIMTQPAVTCPTNGTLNDVAQCMWDHDCGAIPIVDDEGRLTGIVTDRDVCMAAYTQGEPLRSVPVWRAMTEHVLACHQDDSIEAVEEQMRQGQVRRLPVVDDDGRPVGIVSLNDITRLASRSKKATIDRDLVRTLAIIGAPRTESPVEPNRPRSRPSAHA